MIDITWKKAALRTAFFLLLLSYDKTLLSAAL